MTKAKTLLGSIKKSKYEDAMNEDIDPPICYNIRMVGHSFPPGSQPFIPMVKMDPKSNVVFDGVVEQDAILRHDANVQSHRALRTFRHILSID